MILRTEKGFALVELAIVVLVIGIVANVAIPNFIRYQTRSNTTEAVVIIGGIKTSAEAFRAAIDGYGAARDLFEHGFINVQTARALGVDPSLPVGQDSRAGGRAHGYQFVLEVHGVGKDAQFQITAAPAAPGRSGDATFSAGDQSQDIQAACPPGRTFDKETNTCEPNDNDQTFRALDALRKLNALAGGCAVSLALEQLKAKGTIHCERVCEEGPGRPRARYRQCVVARERADRTVARRSGCVAQASAVRRELPVRRRNEAAGQSGYD